MKPRHNEEVRRTGGLLFAVILHNLTYPISHHGVVGAYVFYAFYSSIYVVGTWMLTDSRILRRVAFFMGVAVLIAGMANATVDSPMTNLAVMTSSIAYHLVIIIVLCLYTFAAREVFTEIILAATSLYLILGSAFAAIFALIEWLQPGSFVSINGTIPTWQELIYFSYVTLTSLGYGDILPVKYYAQAFAAFEAIIGVLYTVLLLSRLVGMHTSEKNTD